MHGVIGETGLRRLVVLVSRGTLDDRLLLLLPCLLQVNATLHGLLLNGVPDAIVSALADSNGKSQGKEGTAMCEAAPLRPRPQ